MSTFIQQSRQGNLVAPIFKSIAEKYIDLNEHEQFFNNIIDAFNSNPSDFIFPESSQQMECHSQISQQQQESQTVHQQHSPSLPEPATASPSRKTRKTVTTTNKVTILETLTKSIERNVCLDGVSTTVNFPSQELSGTISDNMPLLWNYIRQDWKLNNQSISVKFMLGAMLYYFRSINPNLKEVITKNMIPISIQQALMYIRFYKLLTKFKTLQRSTLPYTFFRNNIKLLEEMEEEETNNLEF